jgi:hypothetical protein
MPNPTDHLFVHGRLTKMPQSLENDRTGPAPDRQFFWGRMANLDRGVADLDLSGCSPEAWDPAWLDLVGGLQDPFRLSVLAIRRTTIRKNPSITEFAWIGVE